MTDPELQHLPWDIDFVIEAAAGLSVEAAYDPLDGRLTLTMTNSGDEPVRAEAVRLHAALDQPAAGGFAWLHGRTMHGDALVHPFEDPSDDEATYSGSFVRAGEGPEHILVSRDVVVLHIPARMSPELVIGVLRGDRFHCDIEIAVDEERMALAWVAIAVDLEGVVVAPGGSLELPPLMLLDGGEALEVIAAYAEAVAEEMGARVPEHLPTGWCSWYEHGSAVSEADVLSALDAVDSRQLPIEVVQVDDGYQSRTGDWLTVNERFPSGMRALAGRIRDAGRTPGLWLAPFVLHEESAILAEHPEFALVRADGSPYRVETWLGTCAVLDCGHPGAAEWLASVVRTVVSDWGYGYLKLDALAYADAHASEVRYHEAGMTGPANVRRGLEIIRRAAGEEAFLLGCTSPFLPAIGLVDAMRIGPDVAATWFDGTRPSVKHAARLVLQRNWMHGRWWANDPDCLILRDSNTGLTEAEARFLASAAALSGGLAVSGDALGLLSPGRLAMTRAVMPPTGVAAAPLLTGEAPVVSAWRAELGEGRSLVGVLNWGDDPRWVNAGAVLNPGEIAFEVWDGAPAGQGDIELGPHDALLWQVTGPKVRSPRVVGDTGSIAYHGLEQRQVSGQVHVRNVGPAARTVAVEVRGVVQMVDLQPGELQRFW